MSVARLTFLYDYVNFIRLISDVFFENVFFNKQKHNTESSTGSKVHFYKFHSAGNGVNDKRFWSKIQKLF